MRATAPKPTDECVPNLDDDPAIDLVRFCVHHQDGLHYRELFPTGGPKTKIAAALLSTYASNLHAARASRLRGDIVSAKHHEAECDAIYFRLPEWARW